ncbi:MAG TPA: peptide transporter [bacterium]|nr:peptide transporter [bacterium]HOL35520.1 peptide transporter [bacterium]HPP08515.1 peptide transporter [bacterium]
MNEKHINDFRPELEEFQEGFGIKAVIAAIFIGFIMLPGAIYLGLITGGGLGGAAQWVAVILLVEIAKRSFISLKRQEIYILYIIAGAVAGGGTILGTAGLTIQGGAFGELIWRQYFIQSHYAQSFGISDKIPSWVVPPANSEAIFKRTFFHHDWIKPIVIIIVFAFLIRITQFTLGYVLFRITSDKEKLAFPMAPVASEGATALAEVTGKTESWRWRVFSVSAMIGIIFGAFYVVIPTITGLLMSKPLQLIPIPWVDFTAQIGAKAPACILGLMTDLGTILAGFVLPFWVIVGSLTSSILAQCVSNPILYRAHIIKNWQPGMSVVPTSISANMDFWINAIIGSGICVGLIGIWKTITARRKKDVAKLKEELPKNRGDYPIPVALGLWALATIAFIILTHSLVPEFPVLIFIVFGFILTPFLSYTSARMYGITGVATGVSFPLVREASFIFSGYKGAAIWFSPIPYFDVGGMTQAFKQLELTRTKFTSWYKAEFTALVIMLFCSFLFWSIIWHLSPIPSATYPYVQKMWPLNAITQSLWISSTLGESGTSYMIKAIKPFYFLSFAAGGLVLNAILTFLKAPVSFFYGLVGGVSMWPHYAIPLFAGAMLGRFYFAKKFGSQTWRRYTPIILAGYTCGVGLIGMVSIAVALIAKTIYQIIF